MDGEGGADEDPFTAKMSFEVRTAELINISPTEPSSLEGGGWWGDAIIDSKCVLLSPYVSNSRGGPALSPSR